MSAAFTTSLGKLLSSSALRSQFAKNPQATVAQLTSDAATRQTLAALDAECLDRQARTLLNKRWFEVRQLLPVTCEELGALGFKVFTEYAEQNWPEGHDRHPQDALKFGAVLEVRQDPALNPLEWQRFRFRCSGHLLQVKRVCIKQAGGIEKKFWHCLVRITNQSFREYRFGW